MYVIDRLAHTNRWTTRHPADKLVLGGGLLLLSLALPPIPGGLLILTAAMGAALVGARLPARSYFAILALPLAFLISGGAVLAISLRIDGSGPLLAFSPAGAWTAAEASVRALAATASLLAIVLTTPLTALLGLLRRLHLPPPIIDLMLLVYRFVVLAVAVAETGRTAQAARLGYVGFRRSLRSAGLLAAALLPRILDRARRMEIGLAARAYGGDLRVSPSPVPPSPSFIAATLGLEAAIALASFAFIVLGGPGQ